MSNELKCLKDQEKVIYLEDRTEKKICVNVDSEKEKYPYGEKTFKVIFPHRKKF